MAFVQHTLYARDPGRASAFYRDLLGWTVDEDGCCSRGGRKIASIELSKAPPHVPSYWLPYLGVEDVDATTEKARTLGAQVRRHTAGRDAVIVDPRGASVGLRCRSESADVFAWDLLLTDEPEAATNFYSALGGFAVDAIDLGPGGIYRVLRVGRDHVAGVMKHPADLHPHWQSYLAVEDVDGVTKRALELGATPYFPPSDQPGFGRWSAIDDPVGAGICFLRRDGSKA